MNPPICTFLHPKGTGYPLLVTPEPGSGEDHLNAPGCSVTQHLHLPKTETWALGCCPPLSLLQAGWGGLSFGGPLGGQWLHAARDGAQGVQRVRSSYSFLYRGPQVMPFVFVERLQEGIVQHVRGQGSPRHGTGPARPKSPTCLPVQDVSPGTRPRVAPGALVPRGPHGGGGYSPCGSGC